MPSRYDPLLEGDVEAVCLFRESPCYRLTVKGQSKQQVVEAELSRRGLLRLHVRLPDGDKIFWWGGL